MAGGISRPERPLRGASPIRGGAFLALFLDFGRVAHCLLPARRHPLAQFVEVGRVEHLASLLKHLAFFLLDVVLDVLFHDLRLGTPVLGVVWQLVELAHEQVHHVVFLEPLEDDSAAFGWSLSAG